MEPLAQLLTSNYLSGFASLITITALFVSFSLWLKRIVLDRPYFSNLTVRGLFAIFLPWVTISLFTYVFMRQFRESRSYEELSVLILPVEAVQLIGLFIMANYIIPYAKSGLHKEFLLGLIMIVFQVCYFILAIFVTIGYGFGVEFFQDGDYSAYAEYTAGCIILLPYIIKNPNAIVELLDWVFSER